jgi:hypothetical protein
MRQTSPSGIMHVSDQLGRRGLARRSASMSVEENNKALIRKFFGEVWSKGNVAAADEFLAPEFVVHHMLPGKKLVQRTTSERWLSSMRLLPTSTSASRSRWLKATR